MQLCSFRCWLFGVSSFCGKLVLYAKHYSLISGGEKLISVVFLCSWSYHIVWCDKWVFTKATFGAEMILISVSIWGALPQPESGFKALSIWDHITSNVLVWINLWISKYRKGNSLKWAPNCDICSSWCGVTCVLLYTVETDFSCRVTAHLDRTTPRYWPTI